MASKFRLLFIVTMFEVLPTPKTGNQPFSGAWKITAFAGAFGLLVSSCSQIPAEKSSRDAGPLWPGKQPDGSVLLHNEWSLKPAGAQVELRSSNLRVAASKVLALGSATITATVLAPDSPGALLDLVVRLPDGRRSLLPTAISIAASPATAQANPSLSKPTNDTAAFRRFDLNADRVASVNVHDHWSQFNQNIYPSSLDSDALLVTRSATDTMGLFKSKPYDGIDFNCGCQGYPSYVDYAVTPPQYATSIGLLSMAKGVFNGTGEFNDYNEPVLRLRWTFADGDTDTAGQTIRVGKHVRNWRSDAPLDCNGSQPYYVLPPDSLAAVLYTGPLPPPWTPGDAYYDAAELPLAPGNRSKRLASLRIAAVGHTDNCSDGRHLYTEHFLYGVSIWPNFRVANSQGQPVMRQSQNTNQPHGGYLYGNAAVGTRRTTDVTACQVASMAMAYTFAGFPCTVDSLNAFLQRSKGYEPDAVAYANFVSPSGDVIHYKALGGTKLRVNNTFLVEHGVYNPLATYRVTVEGPDGQASRIATYSSTTISLGDTGRVYWRLIPGVADNYTHNPRLRSIDLTESPLLAAKVESLLVRDIPVQLNVHPTAVTGHFVVADGWTSSFRPDGSARGTYSIEDPYDDRNFTKLIEARVINGRLQDYKNSFTLARYVVPTAQEPAGPAAATSDPLGLAIFASGARRVEVIDPLGRRMLRDVGSGEGVYEIPDASIEDVSSEHDNGDDADDSLTAYDVHIPTAFDGHYTVRVYSDDGLSMSASGYDANGIFASDDVADTTARPTGNVYDVLYDGFGRSIVVTHTSTLDVWSIPFDRGLLRVRRCPTAGPVEFVITGAELAGDAIDVFDIRGCRVGAVQMAPGPGTQTVSWDWRLAGCRPGVYLARLRSRANSMARFVVLR